MYRSFNHCLLVFCAVLSLIQPLWAQLPTKPARSCGTDALHARRLANDPSYRRRHEAIEQRIVELTQQHLNRTVTHRTSEDAVITIPVVFHVIYQNDTANISDERIEKAVRNLNAGFRNVGEYDRGSGADIKIEFCLAQTDPNGQPTNGITRHQSELAIHMPDDPTIKNNWNWNTLQYLNFYVVENAFFVAGYSTFTGSHGRVDDGIVLVAEYVGLDSAETTITHEVGHYFNLLHPFEGECVNSNCLIDGDKVCDTPPQKSQEFGSTCLATNTCNTDAEDRSANNPFKADGPDQTTLFMDYRDKACLHDFSEGQKLRMRLAANLVRRTSWSYPDVCQRPRTACAAPRDIRAERANNGRLSVSWTAAAGVNSYEVVAVDARTMQATRNVVQGTNWSQASVPADALMLLRVRSICGADSSAFASAAFAGDFQIYCEGNRVITAPNGTISDGSGANPYAPQTRCGWQIRVPNGPRIRFDLDSLALDPLSSDYIAIYDGPDTNATLIGQFNGHQLLAKPVVSSGPVAFVYFFSDEYVEEQGWQMRFSETSEPAQAQISCQGLTRVSEPAGTIEDGSGPAKYGINLDCEWLITGNPGEIIQFQFQQLSIGDFFDVITIYDGPDKNSPILATTTFDFFNPQPGFMLTSNTIYRSNGRQMLIHFKTNETGIEQGWQMMYKSIPIDNVPSGGCGVLTTVTAPSGTISDGSGQRNWYETDLDCRWLVRVADTANIQLKFNYAGLGSEQDSVIIYDGPNAQSPVMIYYSGAEFEQRLVRSTGHEIFVVFKSRGAMGADGWEFDYESVSKSNLFTPACPPLTTINTASGFIDYGNKLVPYPPNLDCRWRFSAPDSGNYVFNFKDLRLSWPQVDSLILYDGPTTNDAVLLRLVGLSFEDKFARSSGPEALLVFKTSERNNPDGAGTGWTLNYHTESKRPKTPFCDSMVTVLTAPVGTITDGSGPALYAPNSKCKWLVRLDEASSIAFDVEQWHMADGDRVFIYDGPTEAAPLIKSLHSNSPDIDAVFYSSGPAVLIVFTSDFIIEERGFELNYRAVPRRPSSRFTCEKEVDVFSSVDTIRDGSGPHAYFDNLSCSWTIFAPESNQIRLQFTQFDTEPIWDKVSVYDGRVAFIGSLLGEFSGSELPQAAMITSENTATIQFSSDASGAGQGWELVYSFGKFTSQAEELEKGRLTNSFSLYPNPTTGRFTVRYATAAPQSRMQLEVLDLLGRRVWVQDLSDQAVEAVIDWEAESAGIYLCRLLIDGQAVAHQKLIRIEAE
jgi:hypothetical protein